MGDHRELEVAFREEWPRILGSVLRFTGDLQLAEDCVQEAFARALTAAQTETLRNPASWITTTAKHLAVDQLRREASLARNFGKLAADAADASARAADAVGADSFAVSLDDDRLQLIYLTCHPGLSEEARLCTALRAVCGVPTAEIADLFLVKEATMAARLTRAKKRIQNGGAPGGVGDAAGAPPRIRLEMPDAAELAARTDDVLTTVYLLYTTGHTAPAGHELSRSVTTSAALGLARSVVRLAPRHLEARGLLALLLLSEARAPGRVDADGAAVSLEDADRSLWNRDLIEEGLTQATIALAGRGRFALQAGISGLHADASAWEATDWVSIVSLYDALAARWPSPAVLLNRIVARSFLHSVGPEAALAELDAFERDSPPAAAPAFAAQLAAARADLLRRADRPAEASAAYRVAVALEANGALRAFLTQKLEALTLPQPPREVTDRSKKGSG
ncbi:RNA polymerase sigma factor [Herbiconiux daphne]|uniref:Sigma-70 family RNA polymerase sigma factor n=1 Tax=Herbiconiux daphne TaxID=2970914 RepID=A0ABT2H4W8_9MICO|nr:sigma-70 family RNA polymerase sigma factor [Herbiconiux daphne]MCS5734971.1 sigma-70 family RNA polymerase sigma factor [Herbiconiux daphne]